MRPQVEDVDLVAWARIHKAEIEGHLHAAGAILFDGFGVDSTRQFEALAECFCDRLYCEYGDLPREAVSDKVYNATPYPPEQAILFHNEGVHTHRWPLRIFFYCPQPAKSGGETPIVDCREVARRLDPDILERFRERQVLYVRNFFLGRGDIPGLDLSWEEFFRTTDRAEIEQQCRAGGVEVAWKGDDGLKISKRAPVVGHHPLTGEIVFFNQLQTHHISCLESPVRSMLTSLFAPDDLPRNAYYGDGSPIEDETIARIREVYDELEASRPWRAGNVLMADNMLIAHGRKPFVGPRKVLVAMGQMVSAEDIVVPS
jgi:hypothetical protein